MYSARFPVFLFGWIKKQVDGTDMSINEFIVRLASDVREWFGLPKTMVHAFESDREALGLSQREYLMHLLTRRYEQIVTSRPGFDADKKPKR